VGGLDRYQEKKLKAHIILPGDSPPPLATTSASTTVATTPPSATAPTGAASSKCVLVPCLDTPPAADADADSDAGAGFVAAHTAHCLCQPATASG
jgi:hypothetical protein